jgi:hypothetical protein
MEVYQIHSDLGSPAAAILKDELRKVITDPKLQAKVVLRPLNDESTERAILGINHFLILDRASDKVLGKVIVEPTVQDAKVAFLDYSFADTEKGSTYAVEAVDDATTFAFNNGYDAVESLVHRNDMEDMLTLHANRFQMAVGKETDRYVLFRRAISDRAESKLELLEESAPSGTSIFQTIDLPNIREEKEARVKALTDRWQLGQFKDVLTLTENINKGRADLSREDVTVSDILDGLSRANVPPSDESNVSPAGNISTLVAEGISLLPEELQSVFEMRFKEGLSLRQIGERIDGDRWQARSYLQEAINSVGSYEAHRVEIENIENDIDSNRATVIRLERILGTHRDMGSPAAPAIKRRLEELSADPELQAKKVRLVELRTRWDLVPRLHTDSNTADASSSDTMPELPQSREQQNLDTIWAAFAGRSELTATQIAGFAGGLLGKSADVSKIMRTLVRRGEFTRTESSGRPKYKPIEKAAVVSINTKAERDKQILELARDRSLTLKQIAERVGGITFRRVWDILHEAENLGGKARPTPELTADDQDRVSAYKRMHDQRIQEGVRQRAASGETAALVQAVRALSADINGGSRFKTGEIAQILGVEPYVVSNINSRYINVTSKNKE